MKKRRSPKIPSYQERTEIRHPFGIDGKSDEEITINDCFETRYDPLTCSLRAHLASYVSCSGCGGPKKVTFGVRVIERPDLAFQVALLDYGYRTLAKYANPAPTHACDCEKKLASLGAFFFERAADAGSWVEVSRGNCFAHYKRVIRFSSDLSESELQMVCDFLQRDNCPGWTGVGVKKDPDKEKTYVFTTTYDSSG